MNESYWIALLARGTETGLNEIEYQFLCATATEAEQSLPREEGIALPSYQVLGDGSRYAAVREDNGEWLHLVVAPAARLAV